MYIIQGKKGLTILLVILLPILGVAQGKKNKPFYDYSKTIHFGFTLGLNSSMLKYDYSDEWYQQDSFRNITTTAFPGITLGAIINLHLGSESGSMREHWDLRLVPSLVLSQRRFEVSDSRTTYIKDVESAIVEAPLHLKYKSDRFTNLRYYIIGGGKYGYDLSSNSGSNRDPFDPQIYLTPHNISYEFGTGLDIYFPYFKFSPEIKLSRGINNVFELDNGPVNNLFSRMRSNFIFFSLHFEG